MNLRGFKRRDRHSGAEMAASDSGFSLIEVVITIVLMSTVLIAVLNASITSIKASVVSNDLAQIETVLQNAADRVNRAPEKCEYDAYIKAAAQAAWGLLGQATATYMWYVPGVDATVPGSWHSRPASIPPQPPDPAPGCSTGVAGKDVQLVTITITSPSGKVSRSMQMVKSNV